MKAVNVCLCLLMVGCGDEYYTYETVHGFKVVDIENLSRRERVEELTEFVFSFFNDHDFLERKLKGIEVVFVGDYIQYPDPEKGIIPVSGIGDYETLTIVKFDVEECLSCGSFIHEILHAIYYWKWGRAKLKRGEIKTEWDACDGNHNWVVDKALEIRFPAMNALCE